MSILTRIRRRRLRGFRLRVTAVVLVALFSAAQAYASHLHTNPSKANTGETLCALCLHFARLGTTPESSTPFVAPVFTTEQPVSRALPLPGLRPIFRYYSRGPPLI